MNKNNIIWIFAFAISLILFDFGFRNNFYALSLGFAITAFWSFGLFVIMIFSDISISHTVELEKEIDEADAWKYGPREDEY